jgi:hypothetical protein
VKSSLSAVIRITTTNSTSTQWRTTVTKIDSNISTAHCCPPSCHGADQTNPSNASTSMQGGQAVFENKNYHITANDNGSVTIKNKETKEEYEVWGDPHVKVDGEQAFDFWGKTTFALDDGTKVTIDTTPFKGNDAGMTEASRVTITNGDYGVRIDGVASGTQGDLKINEAAGYGRELDAVTTDGNVLQENPSGKGFLAVDEHGKIKKVDQDYINSTDSIKTGKLEDKYADAMEKFKSLISIAFEGIFSENGQGYPAYEGNNPSQGGHAGHAGHANDHGDTFNFNFNNFTNNNTWNNTTNNFDAPQQPGVRPQPHQAQAQAGFGLDGVIGAGAGLAVAGLELGTDTAVAGLELGADLITGHVDAAVGVIEDVGSAIGDFFGW